MLELKHIVKTYKTDDFVQNAVDDVSIKFKAGELTAILGESGSGKSTLLNILSGLDKPTSGNIIIDGVDTSKFSKTDWATYRNHYVGFVFQEYNLMNNLKVVENVEMPLLLQGMSLKEARKKALEKLELVGLQEHVNKLPVQLSGGQCQRVAIARALVTEPKVIMADEPTGALDYELGLKTINFIKQVCKDKIVILVTHDEEIAERFADRIIQMKDGKIISDSKELIEEEQDTDSFDLKKPKMNILMSAKLAKKNISSRILRSIFTSFAVSIGLICIFLLVFLTTGINTTLDGVLKEILPTNNYVVQGQFAGQVLDEEDINKIKAIDNVSEVNPDYYQTPDFVYDSFEECFEMINIPDKRENFKYSKIYGDYPTSGDEIILSVNIIEYITDLTLTKEDDINYALSRIQGDTVKLTVDGITQDVKIVGAVDDGFLYQMIYGNTELLEKFSNEDIKSLNVYLINQRDEDFDRFEQKIEELGYSAINNYKEMSNSINNFFDNALKIMIFAAIGSLIVAGILIALIVYTSIVERTREIGILNALGAKGRNIATIFVIESIIIGAISALIGFALAFLLSKLGNSLFSGLIQSLVDAVLPNNSLSVSIFKISPLWVLGIFVFCIIYTGIIGLLPAIKAARMNAVNALRKE